METVDTKSAVAEFLAGALVQYSVRAMGETMRDDWTCDAWRVTFKNARNSMTTDYYTGTGHRSKPKHRFDTVRPVSPKEADVLHSLLLDSEACNESFNDWCDNFGYSNDSLKAINTYQQCCEIGQQLRKVFSPDQIAQLRGMLQDY